MIFANRMPQLLLNYTTTWPLKTFYAILFISLLFITALYLAGAVLLLGIAWFFLERAFGPGRIPAWTGMRPEYYRDAFCVAVVRRGGSDGAESPAGLFARWPLLRHTLGAAVPGGLDVLNPACGNHRFGDLGEFFYRGPGRTGRRPDCRVRSPAMDARRTRDSLRRADGHQCGDAGAFFRDAAFHLSWLSCLWFGVTRIVRFNVMGYFLLAAMVALVPGAVELLEQPNAYFHVNGYAVLAFALAMLAWPLIYSRGAAWRINSRNTLQPVGFEPGGIVKIITG